MVTPVNVCTGTRSTKISYKSWWQTENSNLCSVYSKGLRYFKENFGTVLYQECNGTIPHLSAKTGSPEGCCPTNAEIRCSLLHSLWRLPCHLQRKNAVLKADFEVSALVKHVWKLRYSFDWKKVAMDCHQSLHEWLTVEACHIRRQPFPLNRDKGTLPVK